VDDTSKAWLLRRSTALVYPSLDEGFGFPILEAQAAATPVVAFDVGSIPEVAGDAAVLVSDRSAAALADGITTALTGNRIALLEAGTRNLARFSWARCAEELTDLYRTALEART
jgi:glycosyltransferase involved in cell wall biosynthesis